ncbi:MAG TPA: DUF5777 family beta-barrel protein [Cyclobacteriaceae bacterium]|nr:DUF5777 family beta-barrel protein [Cyclobacteriaceae bacterium]HRJ80951.1 DUF5777 family beta-barrel protein [Cyclobacteriaceae bacterium]
MKTTNESSKYAGTFLIAAFLILFVPSATAQEPEDEVQTISIHSRPLQRVGNTFESVWIIDNQTTLVPLRKTFEFDILHRFGSVKNGYNDFFGLYAPSNIRIGFSYTPIDNLMLGLGFTKERLLWDFNLKYALLKEKGKKPFPVSVTYFGNVGVDTRTKDNFVNKTDRLSYFNQLMVAKKLTRDFSAQASINLSHMNAVEGYINSEGQIDGKMKNDHLSFSVLGRYKVSDAFAFIGNYDQPITKHPTNNPDPNISFGIELATPLHAFQVFLGNYQLIVPQYSNFYNKNNYRDGTFLIGFNITRLLDMQEESLGEMMFKRKQKSGNK